MDLQKKLLQTPVKMAEDRRRRSLYHLPQLPS